MIHPMRAADAPTVAALHAQSWRATYRGILRDAYLDSDIDSERAAVWSERFAQPEANQFGALALESDEAVGFAFAYIASDPQWGTLLDNLHVLPAWQGHGIGRRLLSTICRHALDAAPGQGMHLWVYEANRASRAFYETLGGAASGSEAADVPGGGSAVALRYVWPDISKLLLKLK